MLARVRKPLPHVPCLTAAGSLENPEGAPPGPCGLPGTGVQRPRKDPEKRQIQARNGPGEAGPRAPCTWHGPSGHLGVEPRAR